MAASAAVESSKLVKARSWNLQALARALGSAVAPGGRRGRLLILCYHRVLPENDPLIPSCVNRAAFDAEMSVVAEHFNALPMTEAIKRLRSSTLPPRAIGITFDDGYADNLAVALPILRKYSLPATVFVAAAYLDGGRMWNDTIVESVRRARGDTLDLTEFALGEVPIRTPAERGAVALRVVLHLRRLPTQERAARVAEIAGRVDGELPTDLMLTSRQLVELHAAGVEIGAHTMTHPILARLSDDTAENEIRSSRERLERLIGAPVTGFAYPNGSPGIDYHRAHVDAVHRAGYSYAVTTAKGCASADADCYQLPRHLPWGSHPSRFAMRLVKEYTSGAGRAV